MKNYHQIDKYLEPIENQVNDAFEKYDQFMTMAYHCFKCDTIVSSLMHDALQKFIFGEKMDNNKDNAYAKAILNNPQGYNTKEIQQNRFYSMRALKYYQNKANANALQNRIINIYLQYLKHQDYFDKACPDIVKDKQATTVKDVIDDNFDWCFTPNIDDEVNDEEIKKLTDGQAKTLIKALDQVGIHYTHYWDVAYPDGDDLPFQS